MTADDNDGVMLAIDTSTEIAGVGLYDGEQVSELVWNAGRNQTVMLLEQIQHLLTLNRRELREIRAIAVASGPGTFNGLRVGLSTAKGLAYGRGIPVFGVNTLDATAYPHRSTGLPIRAFVPAGRGRTVFCDYQQRSGRWVRAGQLQNRPFNELTSGLAEPTLVTGEAPSGQDLTTLETAPATFPRLSLRARRPAWLAEIAWRRWKAGEQDDLAALEPLYVHGSAGSSRSE